MPLHRFYCPHLSGTQIVLDPEESRHASRVLRLAVGDAVELFDGMGRTAAGTLVQVARGAVTVDVGDVATHPRRAAPALELIVAMPRAHRQQFLFEKAQELGVAAIRPMFSARSTVKPNAATVEKWRRYALEAAKQCGATYLTCIAAPLPFAITLQSPADGVRWLAVPEPAAIAFQAARALLGAAARVQVWIGPEGGFEPEEEQLARAHGLVPISLGRHVLRVETAALAVAACLALGDCSDVPSADESP